MMHTSAQALRETRTRLYPGRQVDAAAAADLSQPFLSQLENGRRRLTAEVAWKIEDGWGLEPNELAGLVREERATYPKRHQRKEVVCRRTFHLLKHTAVPPLTTAATSN